MKLLSVLAIALLAMLVFVPTGSAGDQDFTLVNNTGVEINNFYVSAASSDKWEEDVLGVDTLPDGESVNIKFTHGEDECAWDFMVKDSEGNGVYWRDIDLCKYETITLHKDGDKVWATFE